MEELLNWMEIAMLAEAYQDYLRKYIGLKNRDPSHYILFRSSESLWMQGGEP